MAAAVHSLVQIGNWMFGLELQVQALTRLCLAFSSMLSFLVVRDRLGAQQGIVDPVLCRAVAIQRGQAKWRRTTSTT